LNKIGCPSWSKVDCCEEFPHLSNIFCLCCSFVIIIIIIIIEQVLLKCRQVRKTSRTLYISQRYKKTA